MQDEKPSAGNERGAGDTQDETRPKQAGEAETTRFGMEPGDNTDIPATGGVNSDEDA